VSAPPARATGAPIDLLDALEERTGGTGFIRQALRYVFPDHWSFLLGEIALYSFMVLIGTGVFLSLFFHPSLAETTYHGSYLPLVGHTMSGAYESSLSLSFDVDGGLLMRQTHHWAALVFLASIVLHLLRIFFTGAFRKPRDLNYFVGLTMLIVAVLEGYAGYSLLDDLLSGMGLAIGNGAALSIPVVGGDVSTLIWGGQFPGSDSFISRLFIAHVFILPILIAGLIAVHLFLVARPHHTQFRGRARSESNVVGTPLWPGYALRALGLLFATVSVLFLLGGLVQINPIWLWGPFKTYQATNGAQPDWYLGWLIGALRIMPPLEITIGSYTLAPNPFFGGVLFPGVLFGFLYAWPALERRFTGDRAQHNLLDRPRDAPTRTAIGVAVFALVATVFFAGAADRAFVQVGIGYGTQVWIYRGLTLALPGIAFLLTRRICRRLLETESHPTRPGTTRIDRNAEGGFTPTE
jgi:quinol---cytochrome-c reductase cytochrome b subunit